MDRKEARDAADPIAAAGRYPAAANGILTSEGLRQACGHVWRDSNSIIMLGPDPLSSEPVSCDDKQAVVALKRHIEAAGRRAFMEDVLPNLGFGPVRAEQGSAMDPVLRVSSLEEQAPKQQEGAANVDNDEIICVRCGNEAFPLHLGCRFCEDCCDCRPLGT